MRYCLLLIIFLIGTVAQAQPSICGPGAEMAPECNAACVICDIDGFTGNNEGNQGGSAPPGYCTAFIHHMEWIGFVAGTPNISLEIAVNNCTAGGGNGLEAGIYEGINCQNYSLVSNCETAILNNTSVVLNNTVPLVVGQYYWLVMDSNGGNACDFSVSVVGGSTNVPPISPIPAINGPTTTCPGGTLSFSIDPIIGASDINWTVDGNPAGSGESIMSTFPNVGSVQVCVEASNVCHPPESLCTTVDVIAIPPSAESQIICQGDCFTAGDGSLLCSPGLFPIPIPTNAGCDSLVNYTIEVIDIPPTIISATICQGQVYTIGNEVFTMTDIYTIPLTSYQGCDSTVVLTLLVEPAPEEEIIATICAGEAYILGTEAYTEAGQYEQTYLSYLNCDSTISLDLTVLPADTTFLPATICSGDSILIGSNYFKEEGMYEVMLENLASCDSLVQLDLSFIEPDTTLLPMLICEGDSVQVGNTYYKQAGSFEISLLNMADCDSIVFLDLSFYSYPTAIQTEEICAGSSFVIGSYTFWGTGIFSVILSSVEGCDSLVTLDLTVVQSLQDTLQPSICNGQTYTVGNETFTQTGEYDVTLTANSGCDSLVHLDLEVIPFLETNLTEQICAGSSVEVGTEVFDESGLYQVDLIATGGCDSIVMLDLTVLEVFETDLTEQICAGESYMVGASVFDQTGTYEVVLSAMNGCDSTVSLDLLVADEYMTPVSETICEGGFIQIGTEIFDQTGNFDITLISSNGCDSIIGLDLTVLSSFQTDLTEVICTGQSFTIGNEIFDETGVYQVPFTSVAGCDSLVVLDLEVSPVLVEGLQSTICANESYTAGGLTFDQTGFYEIPVLTSTGCDSLVQLDLEVLPMIATPLEVSLCAGETYQNGNDVFDQSGDYEIMYASVSGCDSLIELQLTISDPILTPLEIGICEGQSYPIGTEIFDQSGLYEVDLLSIDGCDSTVQLDLTVADFLETNLSEEICAGENIEIGTASFDQTGTYQVAFVTTGGCDSIVYLELTVNEHPSDFITETICEGELIEIGTELFDQTGLYDVVMTSAAGCDSTIQLDLTVLSQSVIDLTEEICKGNTFIVGNEIFDQAGFYEVTLLAANGCDSIVRLDLSLVNCNVIATVQSDSVKCQGGVDGSITFMVQNGTPPFDYQWTGTTAGLPNGMGSVNSLGETVMIDGLPAGIYEISITGVDGFTEVFTTLVGQPTAIAGILEVSQAGMFNIPCANETTGYIISTASGGTAPYVYNWNTGQTEANINDLGAGDYSVSMTDANGCIHIMSTSLIAPPALDWALEVAVPDCTTPSGALAITQVLGGAAAYSFSLNGAAFDANDQFDSLTPGNYQLSLRDDNGCQIDTSIYLPPATDVQVELGDDRLIDLGEEINIGAIVVPGPVQYQWSGPLIDCDTCEELLVAPLETSRYDLTVSTDSGCTASDQLTVFVRKNRDVFIPNAFSPNGDGINDVLMIYGERDIASIKSFLIFSRWGETVFQYFNFPPNDPDFGWDGSHKGMLLQPGVFVWMAEVEFIDGTVQLIEGDITLIR